MRVHSNFIDNLFILIQLFTPQLTIPSNSSCVSEKPNAALNY